jgi:hypothetical protein
MRGVGTMPPLCYMESMAKTHPTTTQTVVRDSKSGRYVTVRGAGVLKGHLTIKKGIDLTKPIASQTLKGAKGRNGRSHNVKN